MSRVFSYRGALRSGERKKGLIVAETEAEAVSILERTGILVSSIREVNPFLLKVLPVDSQQVALFFDGLSKMMRAGIPQIEAIDYLTKEQFNPRLALILYQIKENLKKGMAFHVAFEETGFFPNDTVKLLQAGIEGGRLAEVLQSLKDYYEKKAQLRKAVIGAVIYPAVTIAVLFLVVVFGMPKIMNPMMEFYSKFDANAFPVYTIVVISAVNWLAKYSYLVLAFTFLGIVFFVRYYRTNSKLKEKVDSVLIRLPVIGTFIRKYSVYKFLLTLTILTKAGIPVLEAFRIIKEMMTNTVVRREFEKNYNQIKRGIGLDKAVKTNRFIPSMSRALISVGIESGRLDEELETLTNYEKESFDAYVKFLKNLTTPAVMIIAGTIIGLIIIAVYLPILSMVDLMKQGFGK